ncbi:LysR family transcriptional regulator [Streptomyces sp. SA15]|uniref:LysR family transcriptional regulator n=1 Tax=Streptomyces sp. SA15 TaxID=934019 RepID=UPI000BAF1756|nr:LysR family transcriptional regulator [Streptomyces sp. SA15]PAZ12521.1 LysR family transcriptional regulator [Streptomyces sp. SA15]
MLFRQLEYFVAVAREKHFARAAESCYVSQPALSIAISKLERELNVTLINRGHNFEGLTPEGERLVVWAKRILAEHDAFKAEVAVMRSGITGTLRLGTGPTVSTTTGLPVARFCAMHPLARVKVCSRLSSAELVRQLRDFELDAAIAHFGPEDRDGLEMVPLYEEQYVLLVSGDHLVPAGPTITWAEAAQLPLALLTPDMRFRQFIDDAFESCGAVATPQVETDSVASLCAHVATGAWASVVPHTWLNAMPMSGPTRAVRLVEPDARAQISAAIYAATPGSVAAREFLNVVAGLSLDEVFVPGQSDLAASPGMDEPRYDKPVDIRVAS